ncbi:MAG: hypothetical protein HYT93_04065 [Parcubacteria group bacterium]|nr:hypothetical protein [Parcubacteria group bacterium]
MRLSYVALLILAVAAVAIADVFLKQAAVHNSLWAAFKSPWMIGAIFLYLFQIFFFTYIFVAGVQLVNVGVLQTVLYAAIVLFAGFFIFNETLTPIQVLGIILALSGTILISLK